MLEATLRLFNAVQISVQDGKMYRPDLLPHTIGNGYILGPGINPNPKMLAEIEKVIGISGEKANASFHKSWRVVRDSRIEDLVIQQILHYITVYGFEALGIYDKDFVYIPHESLEVPAISDDLKLVIINGLTSLQILTKIMELASSGIALAKQTLEDIMAIIRENGYNPEFVSLVKNNELKMLLYDLYGLVPSDPMEYLRYVIVKLTGESLVIKNGKLIAMIKASDPKVLDGLIAKAPKNLASIFYRFKPLFLAMRSISRNKRYFNRLRKDAVTQHQPLPEDYLNSITKQISRGTLNLKVLDSFLKQAGVFRKIRLAYALKYREVGSNSIVYRIRSGKGWAAPFAYRPKQSIDIALGKVMESISADVSENAAGKRFYIPEGVNYVLPATEKMMVGNIPSGSSVGVPGNLVVGIHWENLPKRRIDLDFKLMDLSTTYGWDALYRSGDGAVLFSGDVTDAPAPRGASELYFIGKGMKPTAMYVNDYTRNYYGAEDVIPCQFFVADDTSPRSLTKNYMVDQNKIRAMVNFPITQSQNTLGIIANNGKQNRVYFCVVSIGKGQTARNNAVSKMTLEHFLISVTNGIDLDTILWNAGAEVVNVRPTEGEYVDLSPEALDKTSIIGLFKK